MGTRQRTERRTVGSLVVGGHRPGDRRALLAHRHVLVRLLTPIKRKTAPVAPSFACSRVGQPRWIRPTFVGTVEYREYRHDGLRQDHELTTAFWYHGSKGPRG